LAGSECSAAILVAWVNGWRPARRDRRKVRCARRAVLDMLLITGDAYVDHPSFGAAMIGRVLEGEGLRVLSCAGPVPRQIVN